MYLIDSDWVIDTFHDVPGAMNTLLKLEPYGPAISIVTYGELYEGAYNSRDPEAGIRNLARFIRNKQIINMSPEIMERFAIIRGPLSKHLRRQIGSLDMLIAATALVHDMTLVTRNRRDFQHFPDLRLYEPDVAD